MADEEAEIGSILGDAEADLLLEVDEEGRLPF